MNKFFSVFVILFIMSFSSSQACEQTQYLDGYEWTFHRMPDGNSYHEVKGLGEFTEGQTLRLTAPCSGRLIDAVQVSWEDNKSEVLGELVTIPGYKRHGIKDVNGKNRESWSVGQKTETLQIEFSGKRGHRARVKWIRVFYGINAAPFTNNQLESQSAKGHELIDRIRLTEAKIQKKGRALRWTGSQLVLVIKSGQDQETLYLNPSEVINIEFSERWGNAVDMDGGRFPVRVKKIIDGKIELDKNLNGNIVPKPLIDIHHYKSIEFK